MFHSKKLNNKINKLHERSLQINYSDNTSSFEGLLETDNSISVHHRNILGTENIKYICVYKIVNRLSPEITKEMFPLNENTTYDTRVIRSIIFGSEAYPIWHLKFGSLFRLKLRM